MAPLAASELTGTTGIVALAAAAVAVLALLGCIVLALRLRRMRAAQRAVLGERDARDLVEHAATLHEEFANLHEFVEDVATNLEQRMAHVEQRLDRAVAHHALVRYDAYGEQSGRQSTSLALLDAASNGVVVSSIAHRDQARMYAKQVRAGRGEVELSPEEAEAVRLAMEDTQFEGAAGAEA